MAIAEPDELQESVGPGADGRVWQFGELPANHRAGGCALERCLEGFAVLDGHKSVPSRVPMCLRAMSGGDRGQMIYRRARVRDLRLRQPCRNARLPLGFAYLGIKIFSCLEDITDAADQRFVVESGAVGESAVRDVDEAVAVAGAEAVVSK